MDVVTKKQIQRKLDIIKTGSDESAYRAQNELAKDFGSRFGWVLSEPFTKEALKWGFRGSSVLGRYDPEYWEPGFEGTGTDHPYHYRTPEGHAVAVACHNYGDPEQVRSVAEVEARCEGFDLLPECDFPSWWNPGETTLVVFVNPAFVGSADHRREDDEF